MIPTNEPFDYIKIYDQEGKLLEWDFNKFPDGQVQFLVPKEHRKFVLKTSIINSLILDLVIQAIHTLELDSVHILYMYGARCDKNTNGERDVANVAQIYLQMFKDLFIERGIKGYILAPHCDQLCLSIGFNLDYRLPAEMNLSQYDLVLFPDESAERRYRNEINIPYEICSKVRDQVTGDIMNHLIPTLDVKYQKIIVIDDLCDGGRTFTDIATQLTTSQIDLFVHHGVFSNGAVERLHRVFNNIFVTDSIPSVYSKKLVRKNLMQIFPIWEI